MMFDWISDLFRKPNAQRIAQSSLAAARVELLQAEHCLEHYQALVPMLHARVTRLELYNSEANTTVTSIVPARFVPPDGRAKTVRI